MKRLFTILIMLSLLAVGCGEQQDDTTRTGAQGKAFIGGTKGLEMTFFADAPPDVVYDKDFPFSIHLKLENVGESDVGSGQATVQVIGIDPKDFGNVNLKKTNAEELLGAKIDPQGNQIAGGISDIEFSNLQAAPIVGNVEHTVRAEMCYPYSTKAITTYCVLKDLLGTTRKAGETPFCDPNTVRQAENSGAPVQITGVKQSVTGKDKVSLTFDITHVGSGLLYGKNTNCEGTVSNKDKVHVKIISEGQSVQCSGLGGGIEGDVQLYGTSGKGTRAIVCTLDLTGERTDNEKQIQIELSYDYKQIIDKKIVVRQLE